MVLKLSSLFFSKGSVGGEGSDGVEAAATSGDGEEEIPVDESLFMEDGEDPGNQNGGAEDEVPVDESLFDIEDLDINDDPSASQTHGETN